MILGILEHTPVWVWGVFVAILLLGLQQTRTRDVSIARATILPVVMILLSLSGVLGRLRMYRWPGLPGRPASACPCCSPAK